MRSSLTPKPQSYLDFALGCVEGPLLALWPAVADRRESLAKLLEAGQVVNRQEVVDIRQRCLHALRQRLVVAATEQWVEPDQAMARSLEPRHLVAQQRRVAAIPAVADQQHHRAAPEHSPAPEEVELLERCADARAAGPIV